MGGYKKLRQVPLDLSDPGKAAEAMLASVARSRQPVPEDAIHACFRTHGKRIAAEWYTGAWRDSLAKILAQAQAHAPAVTGVELCLTHGWKTLEPGAKLPGNAARGRRGIRFAHGDHAVTYPPTEMLARNIGFQRALDLFLKDAGLPPAATSGVPAEVTAETFDAFQCLLLPGDNPAAVSMYRGSQVVEFDTVSKETITAHAELMAGWMVRHVGPDGRLTYKYWPSAEREAEGNNMIRQYMGTLCLFRISRFYDSAACLETARRNLAYNMAHFYEKEGDFAYIVEGEKVKLGGCALAALCLFEQPELYKEQEERLYRFTRAMQFENGGFRTFYRPPERTDGHNFYPGETLLYWAERWLRTRDADLMRVIERAFLYYREWHLQHRNPAFIPWHTQAYFALWQETKDARLRDFIFEMNDWLLPVQQWETAPAPDERGRFHDPNRPFGAPHASSNGVYVEGLIDAWRLAQAVGDEKRMKAYRAAILRALRWTMQLQFVHDADMFYVGRRERVLGGLRTTTGDNTIRVDNVQHTLMGVMKVLTCMLPE